MSVGKGLGCSLLLASLALGTSVQAAEYYLIASGLGGEAQYDQAFAERANRLATSLELLDGGAAGLFLPEADSSSLEAIEAAFAELKQRMRAGDRLQVYLIGHGSFDGEAYKFNITGPDLTGERLGQLLDDLPDGPQLLTLMTSSSGAVQEDLQRDNRVVITATRSGMERNAPVFGAYWTAGLTDSAADLNKNELLSARELYQYTIDQVEHHFSDDNLLASEHALISDEGAADDFVVARVGLLASSELSSEVESLLDERSRVEEDIQNLMSQRAELPEGQYFDQLQQLMLDLGRIQQRIDNEVGSGNAP